MAIKKSIPQEQKGTVRRELRLIGDGSEVPEVYRKIILALEKTSSHPMASAFRGIFSFPGSLPPVGNYKNVAGVGVSGYIYGKFYSLSRDPTSDSPSKSCALYEDDRPIFHFRFLVWERKK
jgi:cation transport ATPase